MPRLLHRPLHLRAAAVDSEPKMTIDQFLLEVRERLSKALEQYPDDAVLHDSQRLLRIVERQRKALEALSGGNCICHKGWTCPSCLRREALAYDGTPRESGKEAR